jgi:sulfite reductase alpha subunit-like flavoprotein
VATGTFASGAAAAAGASVQMKPNNEVGGAMNIAYYHASKFGNGAMVAEEFKKIMAARGVTVSVRHIRDANPKHLPEADLYVFSSPGRIGKPKGNARRFLRKVVLEPGTSYAILTTQAAPRPDKKTGKLPTQEEQDRYERVIPIMNELLEAKGLRKVAEGAVLVTGMKGPLEEGWQHKVTAFADQIMATAGTQPG